MASPNIYVNGIGGSTGAALTTRSPLYMSGTIWYVDYTNGTDAASPAGKERLKPLKTVSQAYTNASAGDTIVFLAGHSETLSAAQTLGKAGLTLLGEGSGSLIPKFSRSADVVLFDITADGVWLENIKFEESTSIAAPSSRVRTANVETVLVSCDFDAAEYDTGACLELVTGAGKVKLKDCTFTSTATTTQPESAVKVTNAVTDFELEGVQLDGGTVGWSNPYAFNGAAAVTRLRVYDLDLLNDADVTLATGTTGYIHVRSRTGSGRVVWTA